MKPAQPIDETTAFVSDPKSTVRTFVSAMAAIAAAFVMMIWFMGDPEPASKFFRMGFRNGTSVAVFVLGTFAAVTVCAVLLIIFLVPKTTVVASGRGLTVTSERLSNVSVESLSWSDIEYVRNIDRPKDKRIVAVTRGREVLLMNRSHSNRRQYDRFLELLGSKVEIA